MAEGAGTGHAPRLAAITGLRWWGAFAVFGFHLAVFAPLPGLVAGYLGYGYLGVTFFFVLSGFVLTWSMRAGVDRRTFYWRRFARIYPLHLATLLLAIPVFYSFHPDPARWWVKPFDPAVLGLSVPLLQGWSRRDVILFSGNPAAWTLTCEAFFYLLHPFIGALLLRLRRRGALVAACGAVAVAVATRIEIVIHPTGWIAGLPWPVLHVNEFVLGMCVAWAMRQGWRPRLPVPLAVAALLGWFVALTWLTAFHPTHWSTRLVGDATADATTVLCATLIVATAAAELRGRTRWMSVRPLVALGEWSYAFYLVHATLLYIALTALGPQLGGWANLRWAALMAALAIGVAAALHLWLEKPVEARLRAWQVSRRRARLEAPEALPVAGASR